MYEAVVIGVSAGGLEALSRIIPQLPEDYPFSVSIVQHTRKDMDDYLAKHLDGLSRITVKEAEWRELLRPGTVYIAPSGYHLLVEKDKTVALSVDPPVNYAMPSIDVLFESAARVYGPHLIGVILTGANRDGTHGLKKIKEAGGWTIVQEPKTAAVKEMPSSAINNVNVDRVVELKEIGKYLAALAKEQ